MSHTSTISTVTIVDVHALRAACQELKEKQGVNLTLEEDAMPRSYFGAGQQQGMEENAPFVIRLHDARYDVGLYRNAEDNGYEARCDLYDRGIQAALGSKQTGDCTHDQAALGKLFNMYSIHAATRAAAAQGHQVQRIQKEDGAVQLVVQLAA